MARNGDELSKGETMIVFIEPLETDEPKEPAPVSLGLVLSAVVISFNFVWAALYFLQ